MLHNKATYRLAYYTPLPHSYLSLACSFRLLPLAMSGRYAPLPNPRTDRDADNELDAAFDDSDDEGDDSESRPLNPAPTSPTHTSRPSIAHVPGTYDFENADYDYPPPGSPPGPSTRALPNGTQISVLSMPQIPNHPIVSQSSETQMV